MKFHFFLPLVAVISVSIQWESARASSVGDETKQLIENFSREKKESQKFKLAQSLCLSSKKINDLIGSDPALKNEIQTLMTERKVEVQEACERTEALRNFLNGLDEKALSEISGKSPSVRARLKPPFPYGWEVVESLQCPESEMARMKKDLGEAFVRSQAADVSILANLYEDQNQEKYFKNMETLVGKKGSGPAKKEYVLAAIRTLRKDLKVDASTRKAMKQEVKEAEARLVSSGIPAKDVQKFVFEKALLFPGCLGMLNPQLQMPSK